MKTESSLVVRPEHAADRQRILSLLRQAGLPTEDLVASSHTQFFVAEKDGDFAGCIGLEMSGSHALVRSLAVVAERRGSGIGGRLLEAAEEACRQNGIVDTYLLTQTAETFFATRRYRRIERSGAPSDIATTAEFASICPVSSAFMTRHLQESVSATSSPPPGGKGPHHACSTDA